MVISSGLSCPRIVLLLSHIAVAGRGEKFIPPRVQTFTSPAGKWVAGALSDKSQSMSSAGPNAGMAARQRTAPLRCGQSTQSAGAPSVPCAVSSRATVRALDARWLTVFGRYLPDTALARGARADPLRGKAACRSAQDPSRIALAGSTCAHERRDAVRSERDVEPGIRDGHRVLRRKTVAGFRLVRRCRRPG